VVYDNYHQLNCSNRNHCVDTKVMVVSDAILTEKSFIVMFFSFSLNGMESVYIAIVMASSIVRLTLLSKADNAKKTALSENNDCIK